MVLTAEQQEWLKARYTYWGLEAVRQEIERDLRNEFTPPDVTAFARAWVAAEDAKSKRPLRFFLILAAVVVSLIGGIIAGFIVF